MKLYIETSVPNMLLHDDAPAKKQITVVFVGWLKVSAHELFTSPVMIREIAKTRSPRRELLERAVAGMGAFEQPAATTNMRVASAASVAAWMDGAQLPRSVATAAGGR